MWHKESVLVFFQANEMEAFSSETKGTESNLKL